MKTDISGAAICCIFAIGIAGVNYLLSKHILLKHPDKYASSAILRQLIQILFLVAVYFIAKETGVNTVYLLIGAVIGLTVPMFLFTNKLLKLNKSIQYNKPGKEDKDDG